MGLSTPHPNVDPDTSPYDSSNSLPSPPATPGTRPQALGSHIDDLLDAEEHSSHSTNSPAAALDSDDDAPAHHTRPLPTSASPLSARTRPVSASSAAAAAGLSSPSDDGLSPGGRRTRRKPARSAVSFGSPKATDLGADLGATDLGADLGADIDAQLDDDDDERDHVVAHDGRDEDMDDCFDSDEQRVDVESLASSAPDDSSAPTSPVAPPFPNRQQPPRPAAPPAARPGGPTGSLLSRASHTFYKAFRKTMGAGATTSSSSGNASAISTVTSASDAGDKSASAAASSKTAPGAASSSSCSTGSNGSASASAPTGSTPAPACDAASAAATERHERLTRLIDAQLAALAGARTGFVDLSLLRPLAEQTAAALTRDARPLLGDAGELETRVSALQRQMETRRADAEAETVRKERVLIDAKVALAETMGEVERLRGEVAAARRELSQPGRMRRGAQKQARDTRELINRRREQRAAVEGHVQERKGSLARERAELERLEEGVRDVEGDWA